MELGLHNPVKIKSTQAEGIIKIVEHSGSTPTHFYIELLTNNTHPDVKHFKTSHLGNWNLVRVPVEDVVYREPYSSRCIYKMIDAQDLNSIKTLKDSSLTKKPTNNSQKAWGTPFNYAMIHGNADIVIYLLEKGLRFTNFNKGRHTDAKSIYDLLLCSGKIRSYDDIEKVWDKMVELNIPVTLSHETLIWGTMGYHGQWHDSLGQIAKTDILNNKTILFKSQNKEYVNDRTQMLRSAMYNGYVDWAKHLIKLGVNPYDAFDSITGGDNCKKYCQDQIKKGNSTLEELHQLYNDNTKK